MNNNPLVEIGDGGSRIPCARVSPACVQAFEDIELAKELSLKYQACMVHLGFPLSEFRAFLRELNESPEDIKGHCRVLIPVIRRWKSAKFGN